MNLRDVLRVVCALTSLLAASCGRPTASQPASWTGAASRDGVGNDETLPGFLTEKDFQLPAASPMIAESAVGYIRDLEFLVSKRSKRAHLTWSDESTPIGDCIDRIFNDTHIRAHGSDVTMDVMFDLGQCGDSLPPPSGTIFYELNLHFYAASRCDGLNLDRFNGMRAEDFNRSVFGDATADQELCQVLGASSSQYVINTQSDTLMITETSEGPRKFRSTGINAVIGTETAGCHVDFSANGRVRHNCRFLEKSSYQMADSAPWVSYVLAATVPSLDERTGGTYPVGGEARVTIADWTGTLAFFPSGRSPEVTMSNGSEVVSQPLFNSAAATK